jgi:hypothetical protein
MARGNAWLVTFAASVVVGGVVLAPVSGTRMRLATLDPNLATLLASAALAALGVLAALATKRLTKSQTVAAAIVLSAVLSRRVISLAYARLPAITCAPDMPLVTQTGSELDRLVLDRLLSESLAHPDGDGQHLNTGAFRGSRGFVLKFNREGVARLGEEPWRFLLPFFERVRDAEASAYVLNLLVIPPATAVGAAAEEAIALHVDNSVATSSHIEFLAHSVSVLYLAVPSRFTGGEVQLWRPQPASLTANEMGALAHRLRPAASIRRRHALAISRQAFLAYSHELPLAGRRQRRGATSSSSGATCATA